MKERCFCGDKVTVSEVDEVTRVRWQVQCDNDQECGARGPMADTQEAAIMGWSNGIPLHVVSVAVRTDDGLIHTLPRPARHHDVVHLLAEAFDHPSRNTDEQGFLLSSGRFCRRKPAKIVAEEAGQLLPRASTLPELYSEDVW